MDYTKGLHPATAVKSAEKKTLQMPLFELMQKLVLNTQWESGGVAESHAPDILDILCKI